MSLKLGHVDAGDRKGGGGGRRLVGWPLVCHRAFFRTLSP